MADHPVEQDEEYARKRLAEMTAEERTQFAGMSDVDLLDMLRELRQVCLHEHGHAVVAKHFGVTDGWVEIQEIRPGDLRPPGLRFYLGCFWHDRIKQAMPRRMVGLAGIVAELVDSGLEPHQICDLIEGDRVSISDGDWAMIGSLKQHHILQCIRLVQELWTDIDEATQAQMRDQLESGNRPRRRCAPWAPR